MANITIPAESLDKSVEFLTSVRMNRANRSQLMYDMSGCDYKPPYKQMLDEIDAAIGRLKRLRAEAQRLAEHTHDWTEDDWCSICGADGRA